MTENKSLMSELDIILTNINIKHIQSAQFQADLENTNACILQIDFAMSYSWEFENEIQSVLWTCQSVMLFTTALIYKSVCKTYNCVR